MQRVLLVVFVFLFGVANGQTGPAELLSETTAGTTTNYNFLVKGLPANADSIQKAVGLVVSQYCADKQCNVVSFWTDKKAYDLEMYRRDKLSIDKFATKEAWLRALYRWEDKNWPFVCEHLMADYNGYQMSQIDFQPLMDSEYRTRGGKKKRISPSEADLRPLPEPVEVVDKTESATNTTDSGSHLPLISVVLIASGLFIFFWRRRQK